jgi:hypothetical protein
MTPAGSDEVRASPSSRGQARGSGQEVDGMGGVIASEVPQDGAVAKAGAS